MQVNILKIILAVVLILLASGAWVALDYMNRQEQLQAKALQSGVQQARMEAQSRSRIQGEFANQVNYGKAACEAAADKAQGDYLALMQKLMPLKRKIQQPVPQAIVDEANGLTTAAKAQCRQLAEDALKKGL